MKKLLTIAAAGLLCLGAMPEKPAFAQDTILTITGAGPQGRWFREASLVGKFLTEQLESEGVQVNGAIGKGVSVGNIKRIAAGQIEGGRGFLPDLLDAYENKGQFDDGRDYSNVVAWITLNPLVYRLIAGQEIQSYSDLEGKTVAVGARNSGDDARAIEILAAHGVTADNARFQYLGRSDAQEALANRQIDALLIAYSRNNQGHLGPLFAARDLNTDLHFVDMDEATALKIVEQNPAMYLDTLGESLFEHSELNGLAVRTGFMLNKSVDEDLVYKMTKLIFENWDTLTESAPWWKEEGAAGPDVAAAFSAVEYHPGAQRYYEEAGLWDMHQ
jgi:uncharacterized protein